MRTLIALAAASVCLAQQPVPSYKDLKFPPLKPVAVPNVATYTLPNGMKLFLLEDHELPLVSGAARIRTGNLFDPPDKVGLAGLTGTVMRSGGTKALTGDQIDERLENIAASVECGIGETSGSVSFSALKENTDEVMALFRDVLTTPEFRQDKVDLAKSQTNSSISRRNDSAGGIARREFANIVYGRDNPYGWQLEYATVNRITREDMAAFHKRYFFPANVTLAVWGDFNTAEMKARIEKLFAGWTVQQSPVPAFPKVQAKPSPGIFVGEKQDVTQTFFVLGHLGGELRDKDYPALEVMADILGGGFRSRLVERVRTRLGYAYNIGASWGAEYNHPGLFEISGSTKSLSTVETLTAVREEIDRIRTTEVTDDELSAAKQSALNSLVFAFDTKTKTLGRLLNYEYYGYPRDFIQQYQKALEVVTKADVLRVAREHLAPERMAIVAVGKPQDFSKQLATLGMPVASLDLTIPEAKAEAAPADAASLARGKALLQRAQQAVGGAEKLEQVKDLYETALFEVDASAGGMGGMKVDQVNRWIATGHFRQDSTMPGGRISAYSDGRGGWISTPQGSGPLAGPQLKQVQGDLFRLYFRLLLSDRLPDRKVNYVGENTVEITGPDGQSARLVVDPATGMPAKVIYPTVQVAGPPRMAEDEFVSFTEAGGVKAPNRIVIRQENRKFAEVTVKELKVNAGLQVEELAKKP